MACRSASGPRGIYRSRPLQCFRDPSEWIFAPFPMTLEEELVTEAADGYLADACDARGGRIPDHMSIVDEGQELGEERRGPRTCPYPGGAEANAAAAGSPGPVPW